MRTLRTSALSIALSVFSLPALLTLSTQAEAVITLDPTTISGVGAVQGPTPGGFTYTLGTCDSCTPSTDVYQVNPNSNPSAADIMDITGATSISLLYKQDQGGGESGSNAGDYTTTFSNTPTDPEDALIVHDGPGTITDAQWLEVKDGSADPSTYLFDISGWDGVMDIIIENFWPAQGAISHVSIWGGDTPTSMPEPGTLGMLMFGFIGTGVAAHLRKKKPAV